MRFFTQTRTETKVSTPTSCKKVVVLAIFVLVRLHDKKLRQNRMQISLKNYNGFFNLYVEEWNVLRPLMINCLCFRNSVLFIENAIELNCFLIERFTKSPPTARSNDLMKIHFFFYSIERECWGNKNLCDNFFYSNQNTHRYRYETVTIQINQRSNDVWWTQQNSVY